MLVRVVYGLGQLFSYGVLTYMYIKAKVRSMEIMGPCRVLNQCCCCCCRTTRSRAC